MTLLQVSEDSVALILPHEDRRQIPKAVREMLRAAGIRPWGDMEAEIYAGQGQCLVLARPRAPLSRRPPLRRRRQQT